MIIHYYLLKQQEHYKSFHAKSHPVVPCQHRGVGIMQYVYALTLCASILIIPGHSRREVPVRAVDIVNPEYNDDSSHLTCD